MSAPEAKKEGEAPAEGENAEGAPAEEPRQPNPQHQAASRRIQQTQAQVNEVVDIMRTNVEKVLERDQKLSELDDRAEALQQGASQFEQQAGKLKRKFWWKNCKMIIIMVVIGVVIVGVIGGKHNKRIYSKEPIFTCDACNLFYFLAVSRGFTLKKFVKLSTMGF